MTPKIKLAITGATGFVGRAVLDEAIAQGLAIRALTRRAQEPSASVEWVAGDLADNAVLERLVAGAEAVLHIAGVVNAPRSEGFVEGNVRGTERLVAAVQRAGPRRLVHVSSIAAREPGLSEYCRTKREGERIVEASGLDWTIVRPPAVYGPRDTEIFELFRAASWGFAPMPPPGRSSVIHVGDLARLLLALIPGGDTLDRAVFEPDDGHPGGWSHGELARAIGVAVGRRVWAPSVPEGVLAVAARIDRLVRGDKAKLTPDRARYMSHRNWVVRPEARPPEHLWSPRIATPGGLRETARWYREQGWL